MLLLYWDNFTGLYIINLLYITLFFYVFGIFNASLQWYIDNGYLPDPNCIALIPVMKSNTTPSGVAFASSGTAYLAFNNQFVNGRNWYSASATNQYIGYDFEKDVTVKQVSFSQYEYASGYFGVGTFKIQYSDDNNTWTDATDTITATCNQNKQTYNVNSGAHRYWRMYVFASSHIDNIYCSLATLQFYGK